MNKPIVRQRTASKLHPVVDRLRVKGLNAEVLLRLGGPELKRGIVVECALGAVDRLVLNGSRSTMHDGRERVPRRGSPHQVRPSASAPY